MCSHLYSANNEFRGLNKFRIEYNSLIGRHLVASQDIEPGEIIIDEPAIVRGPCVDTNLRKGPPVSQKRTRLACCVCFEGFNLCDIRCKICDCNLFCSEECSQSTFHAENECKVLSLVKTFTQSLTVLTYCNVITTVRCLLVRRKNPLQWLQISKLQSKVEELASNNAFGELDAVFRNLNWLAFGFTEKELMREKNDIELVPAARHCYGVMRMNAYSHLNQYVGFEGLYFFTSLMSHSCLMNTDRQFDLQKEGQMIVKAAVKIKSGDVITTTYLSLMNNTEQRHQDMKANWFFTCSCRRCRDETELGTFMSSNFLENKSLPISEKCTENYADSIFQIKTALPSDFTDVDALETWLKNFDTGKYLHSNHSIFSQVKLFLAIYYGRHSGGIKALSNENLLRKYQLCCEIMEIFKIIYPGIYQCKGELLFELWTALRELNTRGTHCPIKQEYTEVELVSRSHEILRHSIVTSPFHHMKEILEDEYPELRSPDGNNCCCPLQAKKLKIQ